MATKVYAEYTLTKAEMVRALRLHHGSGLWSWPSFAALLGALVVLCSIEWALNPADPTGFVIVLVAGALGGLAGPLVMLCWVIPRRARRLYATNHLAREPVALEADAALLVLRGPDADIRIAWPEIVRWRENAHLILIYRARTLFHIVPKRALPVDAPATLRALHESGRTAPIAKPPVTTRASTDPVLASSATWFVTREDLVASQRLYLRQVWRHPRALVAPLLLAVFAGAATAAIDLDAAPSTIALAALAMVVLVVILRAAIYAALPLWMRNFTRRQPDLGHPWRVELDATGLRALTHHQNVRTAWRDYTAWSEDRHVILLHRGGALFQFIPLRATDPAFLETFHTLVAGLKRR